MQSPRIGLLPFVEQTLLRKNQPIQVTVPSSVVREATTCRLSDHGWRHALNVNWRSGPDLPGGGRVEEGDGCWSALECCRTSSVALWLMARGLSQFLSTYVQLWSTE